MDGRLAQDNDGDDDESKLDGWMELLLWHACIINQYTKGNVYVTCIGNGRKWIPPTTGTGTGRLPNTEMRYARHSIIIKL
jgi:hypothetical protein